MKPKFMAVLVIAMMMFASIQALSSTRQVTYNNSDDSKDFPEREEFNQSYQLSGGARVEVSGMNGQVQVETTNGTTAEVHVVRSARFREDLSYRKIVVEQTANGLVVKGERAGEKATDNRDHWSAGHEVRERVMLRIPRQVEFTASGINGKATVGQIDGPVHLHSINGSVEVAQAVGYTEISGINGRVTLTISRLGDRAINVSGVNGGVTLRFAEDLNADLDVSGVNGSVYTDVPNVTVLGKFSRQNFKAKIGSGGTPITVSGVNGRVKLERVGASG